MKHHNFVKGNIVATDCAKCKRPELDHSDKATCEACSNIGECELLGTMLLCMQCLKKEYEIAVNASRLSTAAFEESRINTAISNPIGLILKSVEIDNALQISTDFFNAETTSIIELRAALNGSAKVDYELAKLIQARYNHFKTVLFELDAARLNLHSRQKAQAQMLNDLASKLSQEEKEEIKLKDLTYTPQEPPKKSPSHNIKTKVTIEEKMALNLVASKLIRAAQSLVDDRTCSDIEEAKKVAVARGMVMSLDQARLLIAKTMGSVG